MEDPEVVIGEKCVLDWPDNSRMRAACIEQQRDVLKKSQSTSIDPRLPLEDHTLLREKCAKDWPDDFRKRVKCEELQVRGFQKLLSSPPKGITLRDYSVTMTHCANEWPDDFQQRAHCVEELLATTHRQDHIDR
jgi:hypothetical protein